MPTRLATRSMRHIFWESFHSDLKPGNILLTKKGIKLPDFGLARMEPGPDDATETQLTHAGAVMGTPAYMAPEQWAGVIARPA